MGGGFQQIINTAEIALLYSIAACGFYFASIAGRHYCFAAASSFVVVPYFVLLGSGNTERLLMGPLGLLLCGSLGVTYQRLVLHLSAKGAREGQLLIFSLAVMALVENLLTLFFGSASRTLWIDSTLLLGIARQQLLVLALGSALMVAIVVSWRASLMGKIVRALLESRLNLSLRGIPVVQVENVLAVLGFVCLGLGGILWSLDGRIKPAMCTEVAVIGAVAYIVASTFTSGVLAVFGAATGLAIVRLALSTTLEGDWSMTALLLLLCAALVVRARTA